MRSEVRARSARTMAAAMLLACGVAAFGGPGGALARTSDPSAKSFLQTIYETYLVGTGEAKGISLDDPAAVRHYFSPGLAVLMLEDGAEATRRGAQPALSEDPFVGRQEGQIADLVIKVKNIGIKAVATVNFTSQGKRQTVILELLKLGDDWRISDIQWESGSLRGLYRKR